MEAQIINMEAWIKKIQEMFNKILKRIQNRQSAMSIKMARPCHFGRVQLFVTLGTLACKEPLSMGFYRQE